MSRRTTLLAAAVALSLMLAACGSSAGLIPADNATTLTTELSTLGTALVNHDCDETRAALQQIDIDINTLPGSVDKKLRANLTEGYGVLDVHAPRQCHAKTSTSGPTGPTGLTTSTGPTGPTGTSSPSGATTPTSPSGTTTPTSPGGTTIGPGGGSQAPTGSTGTTTGTTGSTTDNVGGGVGAQ